jgi:ABC-type ATPase involved in cell division
MQLEGMFDVSPAKRLGIRYDVDLPLSEKDWSIGLIVGPSGSGKSTIAKRFFAKKLITTYDDWPSRKSVLDGFDKHLSIKAITEALSSVGFSTPPNWLKPFSVLSTGERFRVTVARAMLESDGICAIDEFTSVVDRRVAKIASAAIARLAKRAKIQFVAVTCHYDVLDWLQPDWVLDTSKKPKFQWRCLRRRPQIKLTVKRVHYSAWEIFGQYHYLDAQIARSAQCYVATWKEVPVAFVAIMSSPHPTSPGWRLHRAVCLPDFQGVGIGNALADYVAGLYSTTKRVNVVSAHPATRAHRARSKNWKLVRDFGFAPRHEGALSNARMRRMTNTFEYVGPSNRKAAQAFGLLSKKKKRGVIK